MSSEDVEFLKESLLKKECTVLPTKQDKWVSLHSSFGLVCWSDDNKLGREFRNLEGVDFLFLGESTLEDNQMLPWKVSVIVQRLGIPVLSEIVTREAIPYGLSDSSSISFLVNWVLPYAQRDIFNAHPEKYLQLKRSCFENLSSLNVVVVEKLFYRYKIKKYNITSERRHECKCLLQENILFCCRDSDSHSVFLELSCLLFDGTPQLHLANFLHMITTMVQSGATPDQTEFFITNSQKMPKLPAEESNWSLLNVSSSIENNSVKVQDLRFCVVEYKSVTSSNWRPVGWKSAPGFPVVRLKTPGSSMSELPEGDYAENSSEKTDTCPNDVSSEFDIVANPTAQGAVLVVEEEVLESQSNVPSNLVASNANDAEDSVDLVSPDSKDCGPLVGSWNNLSSGHQAMLTGRLGEHIAFKYFEGKVGERWSVRYG